MVKKLLKYECRSYGKLALLMGSILLGIAALLRCLQFFEADTVVYNTFFFFSVLIYILALLATSLLVTVLGVTRFYRNMFTSEGYLTFTLPASNGQLLFTKLVGVMLFSLFTGLVMVLSFIIVTAGDFGVELLNVAAYLIGKLHEVAKEHLVWGCLEIGGLLIISSATNWLLFYACMAVGQLARKNRILLAVGTYFGYFFVCQILTSALTTLLSSLAISGRLNDTVTYILENPAQSFHIGMIGMIVWSLLCAVVYYLITYLILKKKLNLE